MRPFDNSQSVEVKGQVRGVQMNPPGQGGGGTFQLLLENGDVIVSPYPEKWHLEVGAAFQANDVRRAVVSGVGEYSTDGKLQRIVEIESFSVAWADDWKQAFQRRAESRSDT